jgi:hypothetical protein
MTSHKNSPSKEIEPNEYRKYRSHWTIRLLHFLITAITLIAVFTSIMHTLENIQ